MDNALTLVKMTVVCCLRGSYMVGAIFWQIIIYSSTQQLCAASPDTVALVRYTLSKQRLRAAVALCIRF